MDEFATSKLTHLALESVDKRVLRQANIDFLQTLSREQLIAELVEKAQIEDYLEDRLNLATEKLNDERHNPTSGLPTRRMLNKFLENGPGQGSISLVQIDINNLKPVNDMYKHVAGDMLIKSLADSIVLTELVRDGLVTLNDNLEITAMAAPMDELRQRAIAGSLLFHPSGDEFVVANKYPPRDSRTSQSDYIREIKDHEYELLHLCQKLFERDWERVSAEHGYQTPPASFSFGVCNTAERIVAGKDMQTVLNVADSRSLIHKGWSKLRTNNPVPTSRTERAAMRADYAGWGFGELERMDDFGQFTQYMESVEIESEKIRNAHGDINESDTIYDFIDKNRIVSDRPYFKFASADEIAKIIYNLGEDETPAVAIEAYLDSEPRKSLSRADADMLESNGIKVGDKYVSHYEHYRSNKLNLDESANSIG
ncbi:MAG: hypothetical protein FWE38_02930 [Firmicutes bacterium]|nr:hypothetical protein [Bacillota bacterium]